MAATQVMAPLLHRTIVEPTGHHTASLIFLHGSGGTGIGIQSHIDELFDRIGDKQGFKFRHVKVIYPTAPPQPYTLLQGAQSDVWHDRQELTIASPEIRDSIGAMVERLSDIIQEEKNCGIPEKRIIIGGFSMGGSMAMHLAFAHQKNLKAIFCLSSFLYDKSMVYDVVEKFMSKNEDANLPELLTCHGSRDSLVYCEWGEKTFERLKSLGVKGQFHAFDYDHALGSEEMILLRDWVNEMLPDFRSKL